MPTSVFDPWIRDPDCKKIQDHFSKSIETVFGLEILKFFNAYLEPGSGIFLTWIRDSVWKNWKNSDLGCGINIPAL